MHECLCFPGIGTLIFGVLLKILAFPKFLEWKMHQKINLKPGSEVRALWSDVPFPIDFRIYLFNVTNPEEIKNGEKPILREVGPYHFEEKHEKINLTDEGKTDSVEYSVKNTFIFIPERSGNLTGEEELMLPHIFMLSMVMATARDKPSALPVVSKAINSIFKNPDNVFVKAKAMDLMFRGLPIDCSVRDFAGATTCGMLRNKSDELIVEDQDHFRFAIFGAKNGTASKYRLKVLRGIKSQADIGRVIELNGKKNVSLWNDKYCDMLNGTDGYVFHPYHKENEDIVTFSPDICRSINAYSIGKQEIAGLQTTRYTAYLGDPKTDPSIKCYCPASGCLKAGVMDMHKCTGVPLVASNPHFYRADEAYLKMVEGLNPNQEKHETFLDFDLLSGTVVQARKRLQFNLMTQKLDKFKIMANFPEVLLPLFWIEEGLILPDQFMKGVKKLQNIVGIVYWMSWLFISVGLSLTGLAGFVNYRSSQKARNVQVMNPLQSKNNIEFGVPKRPKPDPLLFHINPLRPAKLPSSID